MIYPIVIYGHQVLRNETVDIDKNYPELDKLIEDMFQTMYNADGIGLAAPQIGLSIRLFGIYNFSFFYWNIKIYSYNYFFIINFYIFYCFHRILLSI